jgi:NAD(P)-dependent dehydrogenase (short-subunit alcohol dehydrogenase family)
MGKLEGKVAVVTGGSSGMALASAMRFVEEGAYVFITGRRQEALDEAVKQIGRNVTGVRGDAIEPIVEGGHRVVFLSSDDEDAIAPVADLAKQLGFAPVKLGKLNEGGALVHARGRIWGPLNFQDLFKEKQ